MAGTARHHARSTAARARLRSVLDSARTGQITAIPAGIASALLHTVGLSSDQVAQLTAEVATTMRAYRQTD